MNETRTSQNLNVRLRAYFTAKGGKENEEQTGEMVREVEIEQDPLQRVPRIYICWVLLFGYSGTRRPCTANSNTPRSKPTGSWISKI